MIAFKFLIIIRTTDLIALRTPTKTVASLLFTFSDLVSILHAPRRPNSARLNSPSSQNFSYTAITIIRKNRISIFSKKMGICVYECIFYARVVTFSNSSTNMYVLRPTPAVLGCNRIRSMQKEKHSCFSDGHGK